MKSKKAEISGEVIYFIPRIIFLAAVLFAVVILVKSFILTTIDIRPVEAGILSNRLLLQKNGISYFDAKIQRVYPGIIDLQKFREIASSNPNILDTEAMSYDSNNIISARMTLKIEGQSDIVAYYNKDKFDKCEPRAITGIKGGSGSVSAFEKKLYVMAKDGKKTYPAILQLYIVS